MNTIMMYFNFPFVRNAFIVGIIIALCCSLIGVVLVLKRFSYIGDGLSHVAFGAMAVASALKLTDQIVLILPLTILCAILLLKNNSNKYRSDSAIAMISVGALAFGYLIMNKFPISGNISSDVCTTLFGSTSILTLSKNEVYLSIGLSLLVLFVYIFFYNRIFSITFDEDFSKATGNDAEKYNLILAIIIATVIVLAMNLVGSLLISALLVFPVISAMKLFDSFKMVSIFSSIFSILCAAIGMFISILASTPVGASIVIVNVVGYLICVIIGAIKK